MVTTQKLLHLYKHAEHWNSHYNLNLHIRNRFQLQPGWYKAVNLMAYLAVNVDQQCAFTFIEFNTKWFAVRARLHRKWINTSWWRCGTNWPHRWPASKWTATSVCMECKGSTRRSICSVDPVRVITAVITFALLQNQTVPTITVFASNSSPRLPSITTHFGIWCKWST